MQFNSVNSFGGTKGSYLDALKKQNKEEETKNEEVKKEEITQNNTSTNTATENTDKTDNQADEKTDNTSLDSYKALIGSIEDTSDFATDLINARWAVYHNDFVKSNKNTGKNDFAQISQRSLDNQNKIITNENEAKEHIKDFVDLLIEELKNQSKYNTKIQEAFDFVEKNFKWDKYFAKFPANNSNKLEWIYLQTVVSALDTNSIATTFITDF